MEELKREEICQLGISGALVQEFQFGYLAASCMSHVVIAAILKPQPSQAHQPP